MHYSVELALAQTAAKKAGRVILQEYRKVKPGARQVKSTRADRRAERVILTTLQPSGLPWLAEESGRSRRQKNNEFFWVIDPLDGTADFIDKTGEFTVMIGLVRGDRPVLGVVYQPTTDTLYYATSGEPARKVKRGRTSRITVSERKTISAWRMVVSRHHHSHAEDDLADALNIKKQITRGSAGLKICAIAEGKAELYIHASNRTKEWDTGAADIILQQAGGKLSDRTGKPLRYGKSNPRHRAGFVATNGQHHRRAITTLASITSPL